MQEQASRPGACGDLDQNRRVIVRIELVFRLVVGCEFGQFGKAALQPPCERMRKPEDGFIDCREKGNERITATHVGFLVERMTARSLSAGHVRQAVGKMIRALGHPTVIGTTALSDSATPGRIARARARLRRVRYTPIRIRSVINEAPRSQIADQGVMAPGIVRCFAIDTGAGDDGAATIVAAGSV